MGALIQDNLTFIVNELSLRIDWLLRASEDISRDKNHIIVLQGDFIRALNVQLDVANDHLKEVINEKNTMIEKRFLESLDDDNDDVEAPNTPCKKPRVDSGDSALMSPQVL